MSAFYEPRAVLIDREDGYVTTITVGHQGCDCDTGAPTLRVEVSLPDGKSGYTDVPVHEWKKFVRAVARIIRDVEKETR